MTYRELLAGAAISTSLFLASVAALSQEVIDVVVTGVDDGKRSNRQQDYLEALINAKMQAIERAGVRIDSLTRIENFQLKTQEVEKRASAYLLPGFQVVDSGYLQDGTYQVVLIGRVSKQLAGGPAAPTASLQVAFDPVDREYIVSRSTPVRSTPNGGEKPKLSLDAGSTVYIVAASKDRSWALAEKDGKRLGYVAFGNLVTKPEWVDSVRRERARAIPDFINERKVVSQNYVHCQAVCRADPQPMACGADCQDQFYEETFALECRYNINVGRPLRQGNRRGTGTREERNTQCERDEYTLDVNN